MLLLQLWFGCRREEQVEADVTTIYILLELYQHYIAKYIRLYIFRITKIVGSQIIR